MLKISTFKKDFGGKEKDPMTPLLRTNKLLGGDANGRKNSLFSSNASSHVVS